MVSQEARHRASVTRFALRSLLLIAATDVAANQTYQPGDRVECNFVGSLAPQHEKYFEAGTVEPFQPGDQPDGSWYRVRADSNKVEYPCRVEHIREIRAAPAPAALPNQPAPTRVQPAARPAATGQVIGRNATAATPALDFLNCPVQQDAVENGDEPDRDVVALVIRCAKGEKAVPAGQEGAVKVDVLNVQIGRSRDWSYAQDRGNASEGTIVYPVKATYNVRTLYRAATEVEEGWVRILNFYVNAFGEWQIGSEENVRTAATKRIDN
ncbi:hypothetical protein C7S18_10475 [Ahniella affigens]|uniref:Uncharacterized protein n=1 Tax=Ahniella affigens TaxID=2021234 RepID=A0A2P1PRW7_9GAMM|nr:hypothetical protein [Ahniella affigens]AVP97596.1 hypothetical protein C7S18_10475 [Ahniella affigens]